MRVPYRWWLAVTMVCCTSRNAVAQLTARDSAQLVDAIATRIQAQFGTGDTRQPFVITAGYPREASAVDFAAKLATAVRALDSTLIDESPTRSTPRIHFRTLDLVTSDTAAVELWVARCKGTPPIHTASRASLAFLRSRENWMFVERNTGGGGAASNGCPW